MKTPSIIFLLVSASFLQTTLSAPIGLLGGNMVPRSLLYKAHEHVNTLKHKVKALKGKITDFSNRPVYQIILEEAGIDLEKIPETESNFAQAFTIAVSHDADSQTKFLQAAETAFAHKRPLIAKELLYFAFFKLNSELKRIGLVARILASRKYNLLPLALSVANIQSVDAVASLAYSQLDVAVSQKDAQAFEGIIRGMRAAYGEAAYELLADKEESLFFWVFERSSNHPDAVPEFVSQMLKVIAEVFVVPYRDFIDVVKYTHDNGNFETYRKVLASLNLSIHKKEKNSPQKEY